MKERERIAELYRQNVPAAEIARQLGLTVWQIRYELKRGFTGAYDELGHPEYDPKTAQRSYNSKAFRGNLYQNRPKDE